MFVCQNFAKFLFLYFNISRHFVRPSCPFFSLPGVFFLFFFFCFFNILSRCLSRTCRHQYSWESGHSPPCQLKRRPSLQTYSFAHWSRLKRFFPPFMATAPLNIKTRTSVCIVTEVLCCTRLPFRLKSAALHSL